MSWDSVRNALGLLALAVIILLVGIRVATPRIHVTRAADPTSQRHPAPTRDQPAPPHFSRTIP